MDRYTPFMPTTTREEVSLGPLPQYKSQYSPRTTLGGLMQKVGGYLQPATQFSQQLPYEQFAGPQRELFKEWQTGTLRPEFEQFTLNPFKRQYAAQAAASGARRLGAAPRMYRTALAETERPYFEQAEQARGAWEDMIRNLYEAQLQRYYQSPTTFTNIA